VGASICFQRRFRSLFYHHERSQFGDAFSEDTSEAIYRLTVDSEDVLFGQRSTEHHKDLIIYGVVILLVCAGDPEWVYQVAIRCLLRLCSIAMQLRGST